jgi:hypothetical protein
MLIHKTYKLESMVPDGGYLHLDFINQQLSYGLHITDTKSGLTPVSNRGSGQVAAIKVPVTMEAKDVVPSYPEMLLPIAAIKKARKAGGRGHNLTLALRKSKVIVDLEEFPLKRVPKRHKHVDNLLSASYRSKIYRFDVDLLKKALNALGTGSPVVEVEFPQTTSGNLDERNHFFLSNPDSTERGPWVAIAPVVPK